MKRYVNHPSSRLLLYPYTVQDGKTTLIPATCQELLPEDLGLPE